MGKVTDILNNSNEPVIICDFSPPKGSDPMLQCNAASLDATFLCTAYSPGQSVRVDPAMLAYTIRKLTQKEVIFTLATRDMNKLAIQTHLLGADLLGLENVLIVGGDAFSKVDLASIKSVKDFTTTQLIAATKSMNLGQDYSGRKLLTPTKFCAGATIDLGNNIQEESILTHKKVVAGADFFVTQPIYDTESLERFQDNYSTLNERFERPLFVGLQILASNSPTFGKVPNKIKKELESGRDGVSIAMELYDKFVSKGFRNIYLIPPIFKGGTRDYNSAQTLLSYMTTKLEK